MNNTAKEILTRFVEINNQFMSQFTEEIIKSITEITTTKKDCESPIKQEIPPVKFINEIMERKIKERKTVYWKYYRAKSMHEIYQKELNSGNPKMPRKFRPAEIKNEPLEELEIREKISIEKFKLDTELLHKRSIRFEKEFHRIDEEVIEHLKKESTTISIDTKAKSPREFLLRDRKIILTTLEAKYKCSKDCQWYKHKEGKRRNGRKIGLWKTYSESGEVLSEKSY